MLQNRHDCSVVGRKRNEKRNVFKQVIVDKKGDALC